MSLWMPSPAAGWSGSQEANAVSDRGMLVISALSRAPDSRSRSRPVHDPAVRHYRLPRRSPLLAVEQLALREKGTHRLLDVFHERYAAGANLPQRGDRPPVRAGDLRRRAPGKLARPFGCQDDQGETVVHALQTVLDRYSCHVFCPPSNRRLPAVGGWWGFRSRHGAEAAGRLKRSQRSYFS